MSSVNNFLDLIRRGIGTKINQKIPFYNYEIRRFQLVDHILNDTKSGISNERYMDHDIIVSLTTFGKRIHDVAFTIESIMQQSLKPNRIILWLDDSFEGKQLPQSLIKQMKRGLEIEFCKDIRSYKKLIPALKKYPNDAILTFDDDVLYDYDIVEHIIRSYQENAQCIHSCRGRMMRKTRDGKLTPYNQWTQDNIEPGIKKLYFLTGSGGNLYPPHCFDEEVFNEDVFMDICQYADDVWFNAMALKKGTPICKVYTRNPKGDEFIENVGVQDVALRRINTGKRSLNDIQIQAVYSKYNLYEKL